MFANEGSASKSEEENREGEKDEGHYERENCDKNVEHEKKILKLEDEKNGKSTNMDFEEDSNSDKENEECLDEKENDPDWNHNAAISERCQTRILATRRGRKPLGELITLLPEETNISEYEKIQIKRKAEQRMMLDAMKKAAVSLSKEFIPKTVRRQKSLKREATQHLSFTRKEPPILRPRRSRHNSRGSSDKSSSEVGENGDSFSCLPHKRKYDLYLEDDEDEYVYKAQV